MTEENTPVSAIPETKPDSVGSMLVNIFLEPVRVFRRVQVKSSWVLPFLIFFVVFLISGYLTAPQKLDLMFQQIESSSEMQPEERQRALDQMEVAREWAGIATAGFLFFAIPIFYFVGIGVVMLMGNVIFGGEARFRQVASVNAWSWMIFLLGVIIETALVLWKNSADVRLSLAILLPDLDPSSVIYNVVNGFTNPFTIWGTVVSILGLSIIYNFSKGKAAAVVLIPAAVIIGIITLISVAF